MTGRLTDEDRERIEARLHTTDALLESGYPGDDGSRQPVHTVYVPADRYDVELPSRWGTEALQAAEEAGGVPAVARYAGVPAEFADALTARVERKLRAEPIEDLRVDFEDGYGDRGDDAEDADARRVGRDLGRSTLEGSAPPFAGIRFKSLERDTRPRALRTLEIFLEALAGAGPLPAGLVLTLPKVTTAYQVEAMADLAGALERAYGFAPGALRFEVQVETPQLVLGPDGRSPLAQLPFAADGRLVGLHYGTYDYSASLGIAAEHQSMEHPAADHAKQLMQLAAAGTGVRLSDGSTNILPIGDRAEDAWALHARLVRRSLERGFYQGWDLHPAQLPTRYLATYAFYRSGYAEASARLRAYLTGSGGAVLDEPATARALAWFVQRGVDCGAVGPDEVAADTGADADEIAALAHPRRAPRDESRKAS